MIAELAGFARDDEERRTRTDLAGALPPHRSHLEKRGLQTLIDGVTSLHLHFHNAMRP